MPRDLFLDEDGQQHERTVEEILARSFGETISKAPGRTNAIYLLDQEHPPDCDTESQPAEPFLLNYPPQALS